MKKISEQTTCTVASKETISAVQYYMGVPDGKYFEAKDFDESVVNAKKAYVTLQTLMGNETAEVDRFNEGKKQVSELITPLGVKKIIKLYTLLYSFASENNKNITFETVRAGRKSEMIEGESIVEALTSTTKLSIGEIIKLGYGDKNGLAICKYKFHDGAVILDMEKLEEDYLKPEEREVLLLTGNKLVTHFCGYNEYYLGQDNKPAIMYAIDVYPPEFENVTERQEELERVVYDIQSLDKIKEFYTALNTKKSFPEIPECYIKWKKYFKKLVFHELKKIS